MDKTNLIGITERADPTVNFKWVPWIRSGKPAILITKRPDILVEFVQPSDNIIIHCTITGLGGTPIEPKIPFAIDCLVAYHTLCKQFGKDRIVLRIDPIIPELEAIQNLTLLVKEAESRIRISFLDLYPHVKERFAQKGISLRRDTFHAPYEDRLHIWEALGNPEVCAEPNLPCTPCVSEKDCEILDVIPATKTKGQRKLCGCLANKVELCQWPPKCTYGCLYCYWK